MSGRGGDSSEEDRGEVLEWFTQARKVPELIGKLPSGERIKGGPYRPIQLLLGGLVLVVGHMSMRWWSGVGGEGFFGMGVRYVLVCAAAAAAVMAARSIPLTMINPLLVIQGGARQLVRGPGVQWAGQPVTIPKPQRVLSARVVVQPPAVVAETTESVTAEPADELPAGSAESKMSDLLRRNDA